MTTIKFIPEKASDGYAIQALAEGKATPEQQKKAFNCIVRELSGAYDMSFDPESARITDFNEGKRHVGRAIVGLLSINLGKITEAETAQGKQQEAVKIINKKRGKR